VIVALACRELHITLPQYVRYVVPRASLGALPVLALLLWIRFEWQVSGLTDLAAAGAAMGMLFAVVWVAFVYRGDPYVDVRAPILRLRAWSRA
jgi:hypothetical protein